MERENRRKKRQRRGKMGLGRISLFFAAGILTGAAGASAVEWKSGYLASGRLETQDFVPLGEILVLDDYKQTEETGFCYEKEDPEIRITVDMVEEELRKNDYIFSIQGAAIYGNELYLKRENLEQVLGLQIEGDGKTGYVLKEQDAEAHAWTSSGVPLISHAGGGFLELQADGQRVQHTYTNAKEPFVASYNKGFRVIEMDFQLSEDGVLCALHGWKRFGGKTDADSWKDIKVDGQYASMTMEDVLKEMAVNRDLYLVTDMKSYEWTDEEVTEQYQKIYEQALQYGGDQLAGRIIPQIYEQSEYEIIKEVYEWPSIIYTLYKSDKIPNEDIVSFVEDKTDIQVVTVPKRRVDEEFCGMLHDAGKTVYTHTINDTDKLYEWMNQGVDGFYTDTMTPAGYLARYQ